MLQGTRGIHVPDCVQMAPESSAGSQASLGGMKLVLMATAVPSSTAAWLRSDLSITGSMQAEAGVAVLTLGMRLSLRLFFFSRCIPTMSMGLVSTVWAMGSTRAGVDTHLPQAPLPSAPLLDFPHLLV